MHRSIVTYAAVMFLVFVNVASATDDVRVDVSVSYEMLKGLPVDVQCMERVEKALPKIAVRDEPWKRIMQSLRQGSTDLTPCVFKNKERETFLDFYGPVAELPIVLISSNDKEYGLDDLSRLNGVFHRGTSLIKRFVSPDDSYQEVSSIDTIFNLIRAGRADYSIIPGNYLSARDTGDLSVKIVDANALYIGVSKASKHRDYILDMLQQHIPVRESVLKAQTKEKLVWAITNYPPFLITQGSFAGQGIGDKMIDYYIERLPQYRHQKMHASLPRVFNMMKNGERVCHATLVRNVEREQFIDFLQPNRAVLSNGLVTSLKSYEKLRPFLNEDGVVDLDRMVQANKFKIRYYAQRSYSDVIDTVIRKYAGQFVTFQKMTGKQEIGRQLRLLISGHLDGVIARAEEVHYLSQGLSGGSRLRYVPIAGNKPYQYGQVGCSKGAWNSELRARLDDITKTAISSGAFLEFYQSWLPDSLQDKYVNVYRSAFPQ